jgi:hypothetical protein
MSSPRDGGLRRSFSVHDVQEAIARGRLVEGVSFADAALADLEDRHVEATDEVSVLVEDCATGERQCFRVDLETGETAPCD